MGPWVYRRLLQIGVLALATVACNAGSRRGELAPPAGAAPWESRYRVAFDDDYTGEALELRGRAPHDVLDQRLFAVRMGHSDLIVLVRVEGVWARGRYRGRPDQYVDVTLGEVLLGSLPKRTKPGQLLRIRGEDPLPADLRGKELILFLRWAPGEVPPYHHHLVPADPKVLAYIRALVDHARKQGALGGRRKGGVRRRGRSRRSGVLGPVGTDGRAGEAPVDRLDGRAG